MHPTHQHMQIGVLLEDSAELELTLLPVECQLDRGLQRGIRFVADRCHQELLVDLPVSHAKGFD